MMKLHLISLLSALTVACVASQDVTLDVTLDGKLQSWALDAANGHSRTLHVLEGHDGQATELVFAEDVRIEPGALLRVRGRFATAAPAAAQALGPPLLVEGFAVVAPPVTTAAEALIVDPNRAPPPRKVLVILVNFKNDDRQPLSVEEARRRIFTDPDSTRAFYKEQSFGLLDLRGKLNPDGDVFGWYTIASSNRPCAANAWGDEALAAAKAQGVDTEGYDHQVFLFPATSACPYLGLGQQPGKRTWINGASIATLTHEIGHNIGTPHASARICTDQTGKRATTSAQCTDDEYGNPFDVMGIGYYHTHAYNKAHARWLSGGNVVEAVKDGIYTLAPQERPSAATQLLSVSRADGTYYHMEYRQPFGFDKFPADAPAVNGIIVVVGGNLRRFANAFLLDMHPATTTLMDAPLAIGETFADAEAGVKLTLVSAGPDEAKIKVELAPNPPADPDPSASDAGVADAGAPDAGPSVDAAMSPGARPPSVAPPRSLPPAPVAIPPPVAAQDGGCSFAAARAGRGRRAEGALIIALAMIGVFLLRRRQRHHGGMCICAVHLLATFSATSLGCGDDGPPAVPPPVQLAERPRDASARDLAAADRPADPNGDARGDAGAGGLDASAGEAGGADAREGVGDASAQPDAPLPVARIVLYPVPAPVATACAQYAAARCAKLKECDPDRFAGLYALDEICRARWEESCRTDFLVPDRKELPRDRTACTRAVMGQTCRDYWVGRPLAACELPPGALAAGAPCARTSQCGPSLRCKFEAGGCGICRPAIPVGGDCGWWADGCVVGTTCHDDKCLTPRKLGESCKMTSAPCEAGATCAAQGCIAQTAGAGMPCTAADVCDPSKNVYCNTTTGMCEAIPAPAAAGQPCATYTREGAPVSCAWDAYCFGSGGVTAARACVAKSDLGQACDPGKGKYCKAPASCARGLCVMPTIITEGTYTPPLCR